MSISVPAVRQSCREPEATGQNKFEIERKILPMRFMAIVKANKDSEAGVLPSKELLAAMGRFNEEMAKAGVMLAGEGLLASFKGGQGGGVLCVAEGGGRCA